MTDRTGHARHWRARPTMNDAEQVLAEALDLPVPAEAS
jgi:hypothetical protein